MTEDQQNEHTSHVNANTGVFNGVFRMLCVFTTISFWIANSHLMDNRVIGWAAMMTVSVAKALLVVLFFMHLWWERSWKYVLTIPALIMGFLLVLLLVPDIAFRTDTYSNERRSHAPVAESDLIAVETLPAGQ
jgi:cytochrome c oxidase subunit 4